MTLARPPENPRASAPEGARRGLAEAPEIAPRLRDLVALLRPFVQGAKPRTDYRDDDEGPAAPTANTLAARALDRLERDLCPRTAGAHEHLVVGIVGPNNSGKSALFNALVGAGELSPSRATGGATRRLVGAVHPELRRRLEREPTLARFPMRGVTPTREGVLEALEEAAVPAELLLVETTAVPERLLLVDTPDFDSVLRTNRAVAAALLQVADVAVAVVTRHTYQNRDVVEFLGEWLAYGRPWVLVYNEAFDDAVTARHAAKLAHGIGAPPVAVFAAPHSAAVASGAAPLEPHRVPVAFDVASEHAAGAAAGGATRHSSTSGVPSSKLSAWLRDQGEARALKESALRASLVHLEANLVDLIGLLTEDATRAAEVAALPQRAAASLGRDVARATMPTAVFLDAFRNVLDRRPTAIQRQLRGGLRWTGRQLEAGARWMGERLGVARALAAPRTPLAAESAALAAHWTAFHEGLVRALRPARDAAREADEELFAALAADLAAPAYESLAAVQARVAAEGAAGAHDLEDFARTCEGLIEVELDRGGVEWALQIGVDVLHVLPAVAAGAVILHTGGLGADVAVAGGGALSAVLAERLSRLLGSGVARDARERWAAQRGARLAALALEAVLPTAGPLLAKRSAGRRGLARDIDQWLRDTARAEVGASQHGDSEGGQT